MMIAKMSRVTRKYVITLTSVTIVLVIIFAGTSASTKTSLVSAVVKASPRSALSSAAHHKTITAASMECIGMVMLLIQTAQAAHLQRSLITVLTVTRGKGSQDVTTPTRIADTLDIMPLIPVLMTAASKLRIYRES